MARTRPHNHPAARPEPTPSGLIPPIPVPVAGTGTPPTVAETGRAPASRSLSIRPDLTYPRGGPGIETTTDTTTATIPGHAESVENVSGGGPTKGGAPPSGVLQGTVRGRPTSGVSGRSTAAAPAARNVVGDCAAGSVTGESPGGGSEDEALVIRRTRRSNRDPTATAGPRGRGQAGAGVESPRPAPDSGRRARSPLTTTLPGLTVPGLTLSGLTVPGSTGADAARGVAGPARPGVVGDEVAVVRGASSRGPGSSVGAQRASSAMSRAARRGVERSGVVVDGLGAGRLRPGQLRQIVVTTLVTRAESEFTPAQLGNMLRRSAGAIANALELLCEQGVAVRTVGTPKTYRAAAGSSPQTHPKTINGDQPTSQPVKGHAPTASSGLKSAPGAQRSL